MRRIRCYRNKAIRLRLLVQLYQKPSKHCDLNYSAGKTIVQLELHSDKYVSVDFDDYLSVDDMKLYISCL